MLPCVIGHEIDSKLQPGMYSPDTERIMEYEFMKHISKACIQYDEIAHWDWNAPSKQSKALEEKITERLWISRVFLKVLTATHERHHHKSLQMNNYGI